MRKSNLTDVLASHIKIIQTKKLSVVAIVELCCRDYFFGKLSPYFQLDLRSCWHCSLSSSELLNSFLECLEFRLFSPPCSEKSSSGLVLLFIYFLCSSPWNMFRTTAVTRQMCRNFFKTSNIYDFFLHLGLSEIWHPFFYCTFSMWCSH